MKRIKILMVMLLSLSLTGCMQAYKVTDKQSDAAAEYMAGLFLKYDKNYHQELMPKYELNVDSGSSVKTDSNTSMPSGTDSSNTVTETSKDYTLSEVLGKKNFSLNYEDYKLTNTYPENSDSTGFTLTARPGYQLMVVNFNAQNLAKSKKALNLINSDLSYQLKTSKGLIYNPLLTLLENDLRYINISIGGEESKQVLLVFEIPKSADLTNLNLTITNGGKSNIIEMK